MCHGEMVETTVFKPDLGHELKLTAVENSIFCCNRCLYSQAIGQELLDSLNCN